MRFFIDSGAGQCMCSCVEAFSTIRPCAILVVGVSGSLPIHGIGTANFIVKDSRGKECIWKIHNCLLSHRSDGEEEFNLISVSQTLRIGTTTVTFGKDRSGIKIKQKHQTVDTEFLLVPEDGLYHLDVQPINPNDKRFNNWDSIDLTMEVDPYIAVSNTSHEVVRDQLPMEKSPSRLGLWFVKVLWIGSVRALSGMTDGFGEELTKFCDQYIAPMSIPPAKKSYQISNIEDMGDLSIRFFGIGTERLERTIERSIGLSPMVRVKGKMRHKVPTHNFPQGSWKRGKTPRVSKGIVYGLHRAGIGEAVFTDTFEVEDSGFRYGQAFVDYRSKYGEIIPLKSRKQVGRSFANFCASHFTPLILIRDNIGENIGGDLVEECLARSVKSAYICPYKKEQNYAEGFLGRITALATYGMVYSGAPMFMWRWCVACAVFINYITATYYSLEDVWATPYELVHNEPFPDSSIVVPFGCGVLVLLTEDEQGKFRNRCALMIFIHYAVNHPLYTYAVYSPRTKRVLYRQDCIFLTNVFPMRTARSRSGIGIEGDSIVPYRAPLSIRENEKASLSFADWNVDQPLPDYQDHITGQDLSASQQDSVGTVNQISHYVYPSHPSFGPPSTVKVPRFKLEETNLDDADMPGTDQHQDDRSQYGCGNELSHAKEQIDDGPVKGRVQRASRKESVITKPVQRRPVKDRWYLQPVEDSEERACLSKSTIPTDRNGEADDVKIMDDERTAAMLPNSKVLLSPEIPSELAELGELEVVSKTVIDSIKSDETGACALQGLLFHDDEFNWCRITGWGIESGTIMVWYSPVSSQHTSMEDFISLDEILLMLKDSAHDPVVPHFNLSRILKRSLRDQYSLCYRQRVGVPLQSSIPAVGSYVVRTLGAKVGSYSGKVLTQKTICRILRAQETMFKYGTMIPRNDAEASRSPEAVRWLSGKQLEWLRLKQAHTFETHWTWNLVRQHYPSYTRSDIGHMFFIYDYKYSGEHRVRLVFDGSRQSPATFTETYAPTVRSESVRLFHIFAVEYA